MHAVYNKHLNAQEEGGIWVKPKPPYMVQATRHKYQIRMLLTLDHVTQFVARRLGHADWQSDQLFGASTYLGTFRRQHKHVASIVINDKLNINDNENKNISSESI